MKKNIIKIITLIMSFVLVFSVCFGCNNVDNQDSTSVDNYGGEPISFKSTDINLVANGKSDYLIVKPENATYVISHASTELQSFIKQSTGCTIPIISDANLQHDNSKKYLSVGDTSLLAAQKDIVVDAAEIGDGGTTIYRRDNTVYIAGPSEYGTLYSVYRFLYYEINFVAYASDCVTFDYYDVLKVKDFDYKWRPAYTFVAASESCMSDPIQTFRMYHGKSRNGGYHLEGNLFSGQYCHTATYFVSKNEYPHLYANGDQLCMTSPEALEIATQSAISFARSPSGPYLQLGGLDHAGYCSCEECTRQSNLYGGQGGIYVRFLNAMAKGIEDYYKENGIKTKLTVLGLMYLAYIDAPVTVNADGSYSVVELDPNDDKLLWHTNMMTDSQVSTGAMCVPLDSCYAHPLTDPNCPSNVMEKGRIEKWRAVTKYMSLYDYGVCMNGFTYHFNTWSHSQDTFKFLYQFFGGVYSEESTHEIGVTSFCCFRAFLRGQQARNPWIDTDKLIADFCENYYGPAGDIMLRYFYSMQENWERIYMRQESEHFGIFTAVKLTGYWTRDIILDLQQQLKNAMYTVEISGIDNAEVVKERIYREYILWLINEQETFSAYYTTEELEVINAEIEAGRAKYNIYR